ncbi:hypothetical protein [Celeribacter sp.]|uniref:hypothetical protein n=1 Tax=Celeribacter sp. TaxID=1890673 RepID=UPI003A94BF75
MPEIVKFELVGARRYVRATDVLRAIEAYTGEQDARVDFIKPLRTHAAIVEGPSGEDSPDPASVRVTLATGRTLRLVPVRQRAQKAGDRTAAGRRSFVLRFGRAYIVIAPFGMSALDLIETSFDRVHPSLPRRFVVRSLTRSTPFTPRIRALWFRLKVCDNVAQITMRARGANIAHIECCVVDR